MDCKACKEERGLIMMPTVTHESEMAREERHIKRLWIVILVLIFFLVGTNIAWMVYESSFTEVCTEVDANQDGDGVNIVGGGDIEYGAEGTH